MPDETVIDGEVVALDPEGRPSLKLLQNYGSVGALLHSFVFDVLILKGEEVMNEPLVKRRELLENTFCQSSMSRTSTVGGATLPSSPRHEGVKERDADDVDSILPTSCRIFSLNSSTPNGFRRKGMPTTEPPVWPFPMDLLK